MPKTNETERVEKALFKHTSVMGVFGCMEVTIGINVFPYERVDYMTFDTKNEFRCYEVKVSKSDFMSKSKLTFIGDFNYLVMPHELLKQIEDTEKYRKLCMQGVGTFLVSDYSGLICERKAKRKKVSMGDKVMLMESMIRSLSRDAKKWYEKK
ncbi:hypothetical protein [Marinilactibacillus sp. 15R]|uniref:hypothetical protein n=1 Tax=Marinilactibacillus sp. 15R TaxID=1911586 RepID=UPI0009FA6DDA|nr:hypothetical protein [Marinilactibacillus sp. 15R]